MLLKKRKISAGSYHCTNKPNNALPTKQIEDNQSQSCSYCHVQYGDELDTQKDEGWLSCHLCHKWFHDYCAESSGMLDDIDFTCKDCIS